MAGEDGVEDGSRSNSFTIDTVRGLRASEVGAGMGTGGLGLKVDGGGSGTFKTGRRPQSLLLARCGIILTNMYCLTTSCITCRSALAPLFSCPCHAYVPASIKNGRLHPASFQVPKKRTANADAVRLPSLGYPSDMNM